MANNCYFNMKVTGEKEKINELIDMMQWVGRFEGIGLGNVYDVDVYDSSEENGLLTYQCTGNCAWSVLSAMRGEKWNKHTLESETKRLNLVVEIFSEEPRNCFQEHCLISKGQVIIDDFVDWESHCLDEYESLEEFNEMNGTDYTEDMVDEDGYVVVGGFGDNYCVFQDHIPYFESGAIKLNQELAVIK